MSDLMTNVIRIAAIKKELAPMEAKMKPLVDELEGLKLAVMSQMQAQRSKRTESMGGYYVVRAERKGVQITDEGEVMKWLVENGLALDDYLKLDPTRVKGAVESAMKETGEIVPGVEVTTTEYVSIKTESDK